MGASRSVSSHWSTEGLVYGVAPCPVKGNRPPADCSLHGRHHHTPTHTHTIILGGLAGPVAVQTPRRSHFARRHCNVVHKLTDVGRDRRDWPNKSKSDRWALHLHKVCKAFLHTVCLVYDKVAKSEMIQLRRIAVLQINPGN